jgi:hypothetical protein
LDQIPDSRVAANDRESVKKVIASTALKVLNIGVLILK